MKNKNLDEMTSNEWESLCDRCGLCCLQKLVDENTGKVKYIGVACEFLDIEKCQCLVYENRHFANPDCIEKKTKNIGQKKWLPDTCAYRRLAEGRKLEWWHPLLSGDSETVPALKLLDSFRGRRDRDLRAPGRVARGWWRAASAARGRLWPRIRT